MDAGIGREGGEKGGEGGGGGGRGGGGGGGGGWTRNKLEAKERKAHPKKAENVFHHVARSTKKDVRVQVLLSEKGEGRTRITGGDRLMSQTKYVHQAYYIDVSRGNYGVQGQGGGREEVDGRVSGREGSKHIALQHACI